jgi:ribosomal subunit interface protein
MRITIKATNIDLTEALRDYVEHKLRPLEKMTTLSSESIHAAVEIGKTTHHHKKGDVFRAEVNMHLAHEMLRAVSVQDDLYSAIDDMKDEIGRQLSTHTKRERTLMRRGAQAIKNALRGAGSFFGKK